MGILVQACALRFISHQTIWIIFLGQKTPGSYIAIHVTDFGWGFWGSSYARRSIVCWVRKKWAFGSLDWYVPGELGTCLSLILGFFLRFFFFWCGPFLKFLLNVWQYSFCFVFWFFGYKAWGNLSAPRRDWTCSLCIRKGSLNHGTTREVPKLCQDQMRTQFVQSLRCPLSPSSIFHPSCRSELCTLLVSESNWVERYAGGIDSNVSADKKWGKVRPSLCDFKVRDCHGRFHSSSYKHRLRRVHGECPVGTERRKAGEASGAQLPGVGSSFLQCLAPSFSAVLPGARGATPSLGTQEGIKLGMPLAPLTLSCGHEEPVAPPSCWFFVIN